MSVLAGQRFQCRDEDAFDLVEQVEGGQPAASTGLPSSDEKCTRLYDTLIDEPLFSGAILASFGSALLTSFEANHPRRQRSLS